MTHNWTYKKLGEVVKCYRGLTYSKADEVPVSSKMVLRSNNIDLDTHTLNFDEIKCVREDLPIADDRKLKKDSIFICMSNGSMQHLGKVAYVDKDYDYAFGGFMGLIVPNPKEVFPKYVYYSLLAPNFLATILREGRGANINNLRFTDLEQFPLPIPSLSEQESIVAELDAINHLIDLQEQQLCEYDRLAQALFYSTFGDPTTNPKGWEIKKLGEICVNITDGDHMPPPKTENGIPFITISNVDKEQNRISFENTFFVSSEYYESIKEEKRAQIGDVLYTVTGSYGIPIVVDFNRRFCFQRHIGLIRPVKEQLLPRYLACWLKSEDGMRQADMKATGIAQKTVSLASLRGFNIPLPPLSLQQSFAAQIEAIEQQKALIRRSLEQTRTLLAARMQYYFE